MAALRLLVVHTIAAVCRGWMTDWMIPKGTPLGPPSLVSCDIYGQSSHPIRKGRLFCTRKCAVVGNGKRNCGVQQQHISKSNGGVKP
jgi:hypothetical protein